MRTSRFCSSKCPGGAKTCPGRPGNSSRTGRHHRPMTWAYRASQCPSCQPATPPAPDAGDLDDHCQPRPHDPPHAARHDQRRGARRDRDDCWPVRRNPYEADSSTWSLAFTEGGGFAALALVLTFAALGAAVVGALLHRWSATPGRTGTRALGLAVAGVLSVPVFWTGLPVVLGSGAAVLVIRERHQSSWSASGRAALTLGVALLALASYLAVVG